MPVSARRQAGAPQRSGTVDRGGQPRPAGPVQWARRPEAAACRPPVRRTDGGRRRRHSSTRRCRRCRFGGARRARRRRRRRGCRRPRAPTLAGSAVAGSLAAAGDVGAGLDGAGSVGTASASAAWRRRPAGSPPVWREPPWRQVPSWRRPSWRPSSRACAPRAARGASSPSRWARLVTMSAYASASDDEGPFAATPSVEQRLRTSAFVIPSSFASSWILIFFAATFPIQPFTVVIPSSMRESPGVPVAHRVVASSAFATKFSRIACSSSGPIRRAPRLGERPRRSAVVETRRLDALGSSLSSCDTATRRVRRSPPSTVDPTRRHG